MFLFKVTCLYSKSRVYIQSHVFIFKVMCLYSKSRVYIQSHVYIFKVTCILYSKSRVYIQSRVFIFKVTCLDALILQYVYNITVLTPEGASVVWVVYVDILLSNYNMYTVSDNK